MEHSSPLAVCFPPELQLSPIDPTVLQDIAAPPEPSTQLLPLSSYGTSKDDRGGGANKTAAAGAAPVMRGSGQEDEDQDDNDEEGG